MSAWRGRPVLVTGASGFVGKVLVRRLSEFGARVRRWDRRGPLDLSGRPWVFHLAGAAAGRALVETKPESVWDSLALDLRVIGECQAKDARRFIYASTANVYPRALMRRGRPLKEKDAGPPFDPDGAYGWAKLTAEQALANSPMSSISARLFSVYGPAAPEHNAVAVWVARLRSPRPRLELWGGGAQRRSWIHVDDAVDGLLAAARAPRTFKAVNLGGAQAASVKEAIETLVSLSAKKAELVRRPGTKAGAGHLIADLTLARSLGWRPKVGLREGLLSALAGAPR
jgi:nucleoside-diphosphate-sugar epimerase